ncbi:TadA family conjugal transfer-associated ATPase [Hoyosella sp. G463]|uniref:TadA family conjugal transfer-associated ATPase n=1 Tax=Lolliginicoccus lacisalsi TaxID=2742202 RepID=A0A927JEQ8_9ACTN|nr:TadA family conjugal transfer-associated ATPase [Lolliginicoccus lacisalsi]MBD8507257.1 TadA family conjugal transfer-associated ATPase [Lolliginicoccus lacisalsi]
MNHQHAQLLDKVRARLADHAGNLGPEQLATLIRDEARGMISDPDTLVVLRAMHTDLHGAGPLDPLLDDETVTDVIVNGAGPVYADRGSGLAPTEVALPDERSVRRLAQRLAIAAGKRLDESQPWVDGHVPRDQATTTIRLHAMLPPLSVDGTCISLRILRPARHSLRDLTATGMLTPASQQLLEAIIAARRSFLVTGGTGTGKTTLLGALLAEVPRDERIICIEDATELNPPHPHLVRLAARAANIEGIGAIPMRDLIRQALRMRPDRLIVGEVRGSEVIDLLAALNTGHEGGAGTIHANSPRELPARLEALAALGGLPRHALHSQLAAAAHIVLHVQRDQAKRVLAEIGLITPRADGLTTVETAWTLEHGASAAWAGLHDLLASRDHALGENHGT